MIHFFYKHKWPILWSVLGVSASIVILIAIIFSDKAWSNLLIQFGIMVVTIGSAILIMLSNNEKSDEGTQKQLDIIQDNTSQQIKALQESTAAQNEHLTILTNQHISAHKAEFEKQSEIIREGNRRQIENVQGETERQIIALQEEFKKHMTHLTELTNQHIQMNEKTSAEQVKTIQVEAQRQVESFIQQTQEITDRLEDVSEHLSGLAQLNGQLIEMEKQVKELEEEKLRRREQELNEKKFEQEIDKFRIKPLFAYRLEDHPHNIFWQWINVFFINQGGDASPIKVIISFKNENTSKVKTTSAKFTHIRRGQTVRFRAFKTKQVSDCNIVEIKVSAWDINNREYNAHLWWYRIDNSWCKIDLSENLNLALQMSGQNYIK